jgi:hypothetical protein
MTHTPGPWYVENDGTSISNATQVFITAPSPDGASREEEKANAALIAAAPELLDALKLLHAYTMRNESSYRNALDASSDQLYVLVRSAIAKATGSEA